MALPIGGFMPIPLAMMIPFMATQSMVMGDAFGQAFQFGKRKISAMSNEEFNNTTMEQLASQMFKAYQNIIPDLKESIEQSRSLQALIVSELLRLPVSIFQEVTGTAKPRSIKEEEPEILGPSTATSDDTSITQDKYGNVTTNKDITSNAQYNESQYAEMKGVTQTIDKLIGALELQRRFIATQPARSKFRAIATFNTMKGNLLQTLNDMSNVGHLPNGLAIMKNYRNVVNNLRAT